MMIAAQRATAVLWKYDALVIFTIVWEISIIVYEQGRQGHTAGSSNEVTLNLLENFTVQSAILGAVPSFIFRAKKSSFVQLFMGIVTP